MVSKILSSLKSLKLGEGGKAGRQTVAQLNGGKGKEVKKLVNSWINEMERIVMTEQKVLWREKA